MSDSSSDDQKDADMEVMEHLLELVAAHNDAFVSGDESRAREIKEETEAYIRSLPDDLKADANVSTAIRFTLAPMGNWALPNPLRMSCLGVLAMAYVAPFVLRWALRAAVRRRFGRT